MAAGNISAVAQVAKTLFVTYRRRSLVGLALMASQAFFFNAMSFLFSAACISRLKAPKGEFRAKRDELDEALVAPRVVHRVVERMRHRPRR